MSETFDVVVAGAGPVGLMLACELRLAGVHVLVVDRLTEPDPTIKAGSINIPTAQAFDRRGLLPHLTERHRALMARLAPANPAPAGRDRPVGHFAGIWINQADVDDADPAFAELGPVQEATIVPQQGIEEILTARATELDIPIRRGTAVTGFTDDSDSVTVWLDDTAVRASWLVGCDGGRSTVRKLAGFDFPGVDPLITGHQAIVEMRGAEALQRGWSCTDTGIYVYGPMLATPAAVLLVAGAAGGNRLLGLSGPRFLGRISYAVYLWHLPLLVLTGTVYARGAALVPLAVAVLVGTASTFLVEEPLRRAWRHRREQTVAAQHVLT